jgi:hypothetical protein
MMTTVFLLQAGKNHATWGLQMTVIAVYQKKIGQHY